MGTAEPKQTSKPALHTLDRLEVGRELKSRSSGKGVRYPHLGCFTITELLSALNEIRKERRRRMREFYAKSAQESPDMPYWKQPSRRYRAPPKTYADWQKDTAKSQARQAEVAAHERAYIEWQKELAQFNAGAIPRSSARGREIEHRVKTGDYPKTRTAPPPKKMSPEQRRKRLWRPRGPNGRYRAMTEAERRKVKNAALGF